MRDDYQMIEPKPRDTSGPLKDATTVLLFLAIFCVAIPLSLALFWPEVLGFLNVQ